ncbi:biotin--[acetyl-CoA-carboxylase] ligase [Microbacterium sp. NPDC076911]|uniref:biotin--[acetyl-CoA-carboxylase] ligase n=1 Tax=Microbacterium sp. NPDC076911 TaxID=3154958 RepID=UPI00343A1B6B
MSDVVASYPRTAAISPRVEVRAFSASTNAELVSDVIAASGEWPHLAVLLTTDQRAGRGRRDRQWTAPAGTALAISTLVRVADIPAAARGWVPLLAGAAMARAVTAQLQGSTHSAGLKWPNDVLVDGAKISGVLAEVVLGDPDAIVVGIGVNTSMSRDELPVAGATSFAVLGVDCDDDALIADYLAALDETIHALAASAGDAGAAGIVGQIESLCTTLSRQVAVSLPDESVLRGRAQRIAPDGCLVVVTSDGGETAVAAGDVVHVR